MSEIVDKLKMQALNLISNASYSTNYNYEVLYINGTANLTHHEELVSASNNGTNKTTDGHILVLKAIEKVKNQVPNSLSTSNSSFCVTHKIFDISNKSQDFDSRVSVEEWTRNNFASMQDNLTSLNATIIFFYALIIVVSFFGNLIVCKIVFYGSRKSTTNLYIGNLAISDLMMTIINIPLQLTEVLLQDWPLGIFLCKCLPLFGAMSVSVSTLTMAFIALDRYQVIVYPLNPRATYKTTMLKIVFIWFTAFLISLPYSLMSDLITANSSYNCLTRCIIRYPHPELMYRQIFTIIALVLHFSGPLAVSVITYAKICLIIWRRKSIGVVPSDQQMIQRAAKWKTINVLIIVLATFVVCWLPLNIYHTYQDARGEVGFWKHNSIVWFACHWFAMSSVCYNPFIYCWLNDEFRKAVKSYLKWIFGANRINSRTPEIQFRGRNYTVRLTGSCSTNSSLKLSSSREPSIIKLSLKASSNDGKTKQNFESETFIKATKGVVCDANRSPKQKDFTKKHSPFQEKSDSSSETFV